MEPGLEMKKDAVLDDQAPAALPRPPPSLPASLSLSLYLRPKHNHRASGGNGGGGETPYVRCAESSNVFPTEINIRIKLERF